MMNDASSRRGFIRTVTVGGAGLALASRLPIAEAAGKKKSVLVFTKSSGFEHAVVKVKDGQPSVAEKTVRALGEKLGVELPVSEAVAAVHRAIDGTDAVASTLGAKPPIRAPAASPPTHIS